MIRLLGTVFAALAGLAFGSFLNVCAARWPEGESIVSPRSHCRSCDRVLAWWENIPLVSWIWLRGRCRGCRAWIGWRYPIAEAAVGAGWALIAWQSIPGHSGFAPSNVLWAAAIDGLSRMIFLWLLVALAVLDFEHLWLPDKITLPGTMLGFLIAAAQPYIFSKLDSITKLPFTGGFGESRFGLWTPALYRLVAAVIAAGFMLLVRWVYWIFRRREGLGLGDVKLMAMLAAWLGLRDTFLALVLASALGAVTALALLAVPALRKGSKTEWSSTPLPFGAFLCLGGIVSSLWGQQMIAAYLHWAGF